jgi:nicotinamidase-related amidase
MVDLPEVISHFNLAESGDGGVERKRALPGLKTNSAELRIKPMETPLSLETTRTALLSMDLQTAIVSRYVQNQEEFLERVTSLLNEARRLGMSVIHVQVGFRPGLPEVSIRNPLFGAIKGSAQHQQMFQGPGGAIHPAVAPQGDDIVVTKHRVSAFAGTDLDMILRAGDIDTLVLFGIATSGVVLSTLLDASDADYRLILIQDCCIDSDPAVHACLLEKVFPRRATILSAGEFLDTLKSS